MKTYSIQPREIFAWIVFICAVVLFTCTIVFAQDKKSTDSTVRIKIEKNENGKKTKIDTTVTKDKLPQLKEYLKDSGIDLDGDEHGFSFNHDMPSENGNFSFHFDREKFRNDMKNLHQELSKMNEQLKDIHIEINDESSPPTPRRGDQKPLLWRGWGGHSYSFNDDVTDSLSDDTHIVIRGKEGEDKPEFEKEITGKHGEKIFIFKRKLPKENLEKPKTSLGISRVKIYPNPSNGKITLSFNSSSKSDVVISITDTNGKEVFSEIKRDFSGQYFNQIDLGDKGKGAYFVKIIQGDDSITKKILVEPENK